MCGFYFKRVGGVVFAIAAIFCAVGALSAKSDSFVFWILAIIFAFFSLACFSLANSDKKYAKCPQCGKDWALEECARQYVDSMRVSKKTDNGTKWGNKIIENVAYKCKFCGKALVRQETRTEWD